jgi:hypothetical protein
MNRFLNLLVIIISLATIASGLVQIVVPGFVLNFIGAEITPSTSHFFAIVGMFMALFGGVMLHTVYSPHPNQVAVLWCSLQKLGASIAVGLGIVNGIFSIMAGGVALFDLLSGILFLYYLKTRQSIEAA